MPAVTPAADGTGEGAENVALAAKALVPPTEVTSRDALAPSRGEGTNAKGATPSTVAAGLLKPVSAMPVPATAPSDPIPTLVADKARATSASASLLGKAPASVSPVLGGTAVETADVGAPTAPPSTTNPLAPGIETQGTGVDMQAMVDAVRATVAMAARQGSAQARIALQPEELGGIRVHLSQTSEGLLARLVGDTPAGAQALAGGRAELHRALSSLGLPLLRMDIGAGSQSHGDARDGRAAGRSQAGGLAGSAAQSEEEQSETERELGFENTPQPLQPGSGLVNVLA